MKVPLALATAVIVIASEEAPAAKLPIVIVVSSSLVKPVGRASTKTTPVASEGPTLVTTIVKVNSSPTKTVSLSTVLETSKITLGLTVKLTSSDLLSLPSKIEALATLMEVPLLLTKKVTIKLEFSPAGKLSKDQTLLPS